MVIGIYLYVDNGMFDTSICDYSRKYGLLWNYDADNSNNDIHLNDGKVIIHVIVVVWILLIVIVFFVCLFDWKIDIYTCIYICALFEIYNL